MFLLLNTRSSIALYIFRILYEKELKTDFYTVRFTFALNKEIFTGTVRALYKTLAYSVRHGSRFLQKRSDYQSGTVRAFNLRKSRNGSRF